MFFNDPEEEKTNLKLVDNDCILVNKSQKISDNLKFLWHDIISSGQDVKCNMVWLPQKNGIYEWIIFESIIILIIINLFQ